ncbi:neuraminidase-like domain-containing protein [Pseudomonas japonica]|uniref:Tc toxin subunit A-related protein n=1 Tax=Pseudomonas japonica TaxID=256466 RepID=UPI003818583F
MNAIFATLAEDHRDALVAYYLGQIVPQHPVAGARGLVTEQDLYEFLLIDNQVSAKVDTSRIAMGMASLQQYIHAIFNGMEPGYLGMLEGREQEQWRVAKSEYSVWGANQKLRDYPENYLVPSLRLKQTEAFREFIGNTDQSRISKDSVQRALVHYLDRFERISNLQIISGYIDGMDLRKADYYFIGRQNVEPRAWFWRKVAVYFDDPAEEEEEATAEDDDYLSPTAWDEWMPVEVPKGHEVVLMRPLVVDGRLHVAWVEHRREQRPMPAARAEVPGLMEEVPRYTIKLAYRSLEGTWSVPMSYALEQEGKLHYPRLVAFVNEADPQAKKIVIGFTAIKGTTAEGLALDLRFNVLFQGVVADDGGDGSLIERIVSGIKHFIEPPNALHHPLATDAPMHLQVRNNPEGKHAIAGPVNNRIYLDCSIGFDDKGPLLRIRGHSDFWWGYYDPYVTDLFIAAFQKGQELWSRTIKVQLNGNAQTNLHLIRVDDSEPVEVALGFTEEGLLSKNHYDVTFPQSAPVAPTLVTNSGGQFLDLGSLGLKGLRYVRLNTLFAKELVARAMVSVDALLSWDTQHIEETALPGQTNKQLMDFHGANGRYFWELFFHIPHALAWRLHHEFDFQGAEQWLHCIFNPQARIKPTIPPSPFYWSVRPLEEPGRGEYEVDGIADPDAICYSRPEHYRKGIFAFYVQNLLAYGDLLYRRLTRDSLNEAKLMYVRALSLLGPRPENRMIGRWEPVTLAEAAKPDAALFAAIEAQLPANLPLLQRCNATPWLELLDSPRFRLPVNTQLLDLWDELERRVRYLRDNLTIDGKPLLLPLYAPLADPLDLLRAQNSGSGLVQRSVGSLAPIPPFRFRALLPRLQGAVETLSRFGEQVRQYRELKDRALQEELQQAHVLELSQFAIQLQEVALEQADASLLALQASRRVVDQRRAHYERLAEENLSVSEQKSLMLYQQASLGASAGHALEAAAGATQMGSMIVTAFGGGHNRLGDALEATARVTHLLSSLDRLAGDRLAITEQYRRRQEEWLLHRDQAAAELEAIDEQITAQHAAIEMVRVQLQQASKAEQQSHDYYRFLKTRNTNADLYQWLLSQLSTFYFQAYDAVVALCLNGEACWQYEMGDYQTRFIQPNVWFDNYYGLTAGEALRLQLLRMESAWLKRFERRLELVRTVSLKELFDSRQNGDLDWNQALEALLGEGKVSFELTPRLFDGDYPGHYLRQLVSVSVSLPALVGPYQDVQAVLTQVASRTVLKADERAMNALYDQQDSDTSNILYNPRASQSICLSRGLDDHGVFQLDFNDERYLPFEGTGALSNWQLQFPRHQSQRQQQLLQSLTDIIVQVRYTSLDGGPEFAAHVEELLGD